MESEPIFVQFDAAEIAFGGPSNESTALLFGAIEILTESRASLGHHNLNIGVIVFPTTQALAYERPTRK